MAPKKGTVAFLWLVGRHFGPYWHIWLHPLTTCKLLTVQKISDDMEFMKWVLGISRPPQSTTLPRLHNNLQARHYILWGLLWGVVKSLQLLQCSDFVSVGWT